MTTIAYSHRDKEVAFDSRMTQGDLIVDDNCTKIKVVNGVKFLAAGNAADIDLFIAMYFDQMLRAEVEVSALVINDGIAYYAYNDREQGISNLKLDFDYSIGSGSLFAISAMDMGRTAAQAVKYAATRDTCTGGKVRTIKVK